MHSFIPAYDTQFSPREEKQFTEWEFQRRRSGQLEFIKHGVPLSARHQEWIIVREKRPEQAAWAVVDTDKQNAPPYFQDDSQIRSYDGRHQDQSTSSPFACPKNGPADSDPVESEHGNSEAMSSDSDDLDDHPNNGASRMSMAKVCQPLYLHPFLPKKDRDS